MLLVIPDVESLAGKQKVCLISLPFAVYLESVPLSNLFPHIWPFRGGGGGDIVCAQIVGCGSRAERVILRERCPEKRGSGQTQLRR